MITQGAFNHLFRPGLRKDFLDSFEQFETQYTEYLKSGTIDGPEIEATIMTGMPRLLERFDGEEVTFDDPVLGPKVAAVDREFALGFQLTRRTVEDDKYNKANQAAKWLAHAARMTAEFRSAELLDDATTGTTFNGIDGKPLCDTGHTLINSSSTVSNQAATPVGFSLAGLNALLDLSQLVKDENGDPANFTQTDTVIYNTSEITKAMQIFGSSLEPFTADNQDNAVGKRMSGYKQIIKRYTTSTTSYFLMNSKINDCHFLTRRAVDFDDTFDFKTDAAQYKTTTRFLIWFVNWRGWFGSFPS